MIVAVYNRTFGKEDIPAISKILSALQAHKIQLVFYKDFYNQLKDKETKIGVIGLGYVGLPLSIALRIPKVS